MLESAFKGMMVALTSIGVDNELDAHFILTGIPSYIRFLFEMIGSVLKPSIVSSMYE
jgi:hypothetical protein